MKSHVRVLALFALLASASASVAALAAVTLGTQRDTLKGVPKAIAIDAKFRLNGVASDQAVAGAVKTALSKGGFTIDPASPVTLVLTVEAQDAGNRAVAIRTRVDVMQTVDLPAGQWRVITWSDDHGLRVVSPDAVDKLVIHDLTNSVGRFLNDHRQVN
jgi:predicted naringenin-chalcone synthase